MTNQQSRGHKLIGPSTMQSPRIFPLSNFIHNDFKHLYYPFGNSPAEDFLQSVAVSECNKPAILSLGCGDMRSCMYTLWKNFGFEAENYNGFKGVNFVLNDRSASILARNILFLYLCMSMPDEGGSRKEWIASMWSLWYNHELQPKHNELLFKALAQLIQWSCTWQEWSECRFGKVVKFSSPAAFATVKKVWNKWHTHSTELQSVHKMKFERNSFQCHRLSAYKKPRGEALQMVAQHDVNNFMLKTTIIVQPPERVSRMEKDYLHYLMEGTVWAEDVLDIPSSTTDMVINPTFFERADGKYSLHYTLTPYIGFIQTFQYTHAEVKRSLGKESRLLQFLPVADHHFDTVPLLANSVQQFSMWLVATAHMIKKTSGSKVSFTFDLDDAINLCYSLFHQPKNYSKLGEELVKYDAIYTSNLLDHLSPPSLVLSALPLLKSTGILYTDTFRYIVTASTTGEYLEKTFGFSPELFPVFLGIHCLGHDGTYSSTVNPQPSPDFLYSMRKTLLWRNIKSQPLVIENLKESLHTTEYLLKLVTPCTETFLIVLHRFIEQFQPPLSSHHSLQPLGTAIRKNFLLQPHLIQLQTQSLLHGIHMHIILTDEDCPLCRGQPLESYIQQFTVSFDIGSKVSTNETPTFKIWLFSESGDVAIVTSVGGRSSGSTVILDFFLPKQCCSRYSKFKVTMKRIENEQQCASGSMCDLTHSTTEYLFLKKRVQCTDEKSAHTCTLGDIVKHIGDDCTFETVISMNTPCQRAMESSKLSAKCVESNQLKLSCGTLTDVIVYPYTIDESKVHIKLSKKRNLISITATRDCNILPKEKPTFYVDSSNKLSLPRFRCSSDAMEKYTLEFQSDLNTKDHPLYNAKQTFQLLFGNSGEKFFTLAFPSKNVAGAPDWYALVCIHDMRFSVTFSSPVLDVSYCFLDTKPRHLIMELAKMIRELGRIKNIMVNDGEYKLLKEIFGYFSSTTYSAFSRERHTVSLPQEKNRLWKHFEHAVLFLLYPNPENQKLKKILQSIPALVTRQDNLSVSNEQLAQLGLGSTDKCSLCGQASTTLLNCTHCQQAKYCGRECQQIHWKIHKQVCNVADKTPQKKKSTPTEDEPSKSRLTTNNLSSDSNKASKNHSEEVQYKPSKNIPTQTEVTGSPVCMRCKKSAHIHCSCGSVSYCSKESQTLEVPDHSKNCSQLADSSSTSELPNTSPASKAQDHSDYSKIIPASVTRQENPSEQLAQLVLGGTDKCSFCGQASTTLKNCARCRQAKYCGRECQQMHWKIHKRVCNVADKTPQKKKSTPTEDEPSKSRLTTNNQSSDSNKASKNHSEEVQYKPSKNIPTQTEVTGSPVCMRCKKSAHIHCSCGSVSYCSKECQTLELPDHSKECSQLADNSSTSELPNTSPDSKAQDHSDYSETIPASVTRQENPSEQLAQPVLGGTDKCSFCGQASTTLKNCARCRQAKYCGRECQQMHWKIHKRVCNVADKNPQKQKSTSTEDEPCTSTLIQTHTNNLSSDSNKVSKNHSEEVQFKPSKNVPTKTEVTRNPVCMRCKKSAHIHCSCGSVSYCSKECQTLELPDHGKKCSQLADNSSTSELPPTSPASKAQGHNDYPEIVPTSIASSKCAHCAKTKSSLKRCSKCRSVSYCSVECQRLHWLQHKSTCSAIVRK